MKTLIHSVLSGVCILLVGSASDAKTGLRVVPFDPEKPTTQYKITKRSSVGGTQIGTSGSFVLQDAIVYYLPKELIQVTTTYSLYKRRVWASADQTQDPIEISYYAQVDKPSTLQLLSVPDKKLGFQVITNKLHGLVTATQTANLSIGDNGVLTGVNLTFSDRTAAIIENIADTAANIAVAVAAFGAQPGQTSKVDLVTTVDITKVIDPEEMRKCTASGGFNTKDIYGSSDMQYMNVVLALQERGARLRSDPPHVLLSISATPPLVDVSSAQLVGTANYFDGLIARVPGFMQFNVQIQNYNGSGHPEGSPVLNYSGTGSLAQTGGFVKIAATSHMFQDTSHNISLSAAGAVISYGTTSTSPVEEFTEMTKNVSGSVSSAAGNFLHGSKK